MRVRRLLMAGGLVALSLVACGDGSAPKRGTPPAGGEPTAPPPEHFEGIWVLNSGTGPNGAIPLVEGYDVTLDLEGRDFVGRAACNAYGGLVRTERSPFDVHGLASEQMGCSPPVNHSEQMYLEALILVERAELAGDALTLSGDDVELTFTRLVPVPVSEIVGRTWVLASWDNGGETRPARGSPAELLLKSDGQVRGTTGCNRFYGTWAERWNQIYFNSFGVRGRCPAELDEQASTVLGVLGDGFTAAVEDGELVLTGDLSPDPVSITYSEK